MGEMEVPADAYYGASTQRAVLNFPISGLHIERSLIAGRLAEEDESREVREQPVAPRAEDQHRAIAQLLPAGGGMPVDRQPPLAGHQRERGVAGVRSGDQSQLFRGRVLFRARFAEGTRAIRE